MPIMEHEWNCWQLRSGQALNYPEVTLPAFGCTETIVQCILHCTFSTYCMISSSQVFLRSNLEQHLEIISFLLGGKASDIIIAYLCGWSGGACLIYISTTFSWEAHAVRRDLSAAST